MSSTCWLEEVADWQHGGVTTLGPENSWGIVDDADLDDDLDEEDDDWDDEEDDLDDWDDEDDEDDWDDDEYDDDDDEYDDDDDFA